jgi:hypothetical protein
MSIERFKRYSGKMVAVQLRHKLFMLSYGGTAMLDGQEQHGMVPAMFPEQRGRDEHGNEQVIPASGVGFSEVMPAAMCEVTSDGSLLLHVIDPATRAKLVIDVDPSEIVYITSVERAPAQIIKP